jgi:Flp pilus assembly protein TadG
LRDSGGTSGVEFALIAPVLAMLVVGIADFGRGLNRKYQIDQASHRALELVFTGSTKGDYTESVKAEAMSASGEPAANVTVVNWCECDGVKQASVDAACADGQQTAIFVTVTIVSDFEPMFSYGPLGRTFAGSVNGKVRLTARSTLRAQ